MDKDNIDYKKGINVNGKILLREVRFQALLNPSDPNSVSLNIKDNITVAGVSLTGFTLAYSRRISFEPSSFFDAVVSFESAVQFESNEALKALKTAEDAEQWIKQNEVRIVNTFGLPGRASQILSDLTFSAGYNPFVSEPRFISDQTKEG